MNAWRASILALGGAAMLMFGALSGASAQEPQPSRWEEIPVLDGTVTLGFDGAVLDMQQGPTVQVINFWRPLLFKGDPWPVAGRMDCRFAARSVDFNESLFDLDGRFAEQAQQRKASGMGDQRENRDYGDLMRRLDIVGFRIKPHEHYVHSLIVFRRADKLDDIRMDCTFRHDEFAKEADYDVLVDRYTKVTFATPFPSAVDEKTKS